MPPKWDPVSGPAHKLVSLYSLLLFTGRAWSLKQLADQLGCSKQTVLRNVEALEGQSWAKLESSMRSGQRFFRMSPKGRRPSLSFSPNELAQLALCRDLVAHMLPDGVRESLGGCLGKTGLMLENPDNRDEALSSIAHAQTKGGVDYSPHQRTIETLIQAIREQRVCEVSYVSANRTEPKIYHFAPMRLVLFHDSLYAAGHVVCSRGASEIRRTVQLCVHRLQDVIPTRRTHAFDPPRELEKNTFGFMSGDPFPCRVKFHKDAARFVRERSWSGDQEITESEDGGLELAFTATSIQEVANWVLSFGGKAQALEPAELRRDIADRAKRVAESHQGRG